MPLPGAPTSCHAYRTTPTWHPSPVEGLCSSVIDVLFSPVLPPRRRFGCPCLLDPPGASLTTHSRRSPSSQPSHLVPPSVSLWPSPPGSAPPITESQGTLQRPRQWANPRRSLAGVGRTLQGACCLRYGSVGCVAQRLELNIHLSLPKAQQYVR